MANKSPAARSVIRFRAPTLLKRKLSALARKQRRPAAAMIREKLWAIVEEDEARQVLPASIRETGSNGTGHLPVGARK